MSVKWRTEPLLVEVVSNETDAATKDEETIESPDLDAFVGCFGGKDTTVVQEVDKADSDATVDVDDELGGVSFGFVRNGGTYGMFLACGYFLNGKPVVMKRVAWEVLPHVSLDELDTELFTDLILWPIPGTS